MCKCGQELRSCAKSPLPLMDPHPGQALLFTVGGARMGFKHCFPSNPPLRSGSTLFLPWAVAHIFQDTFLHSITSCPRKGDRERTPGVLGKSYKNSLLDVVSKLPTDFGMLELFDGTGFDLTHTLPGDIEFFANLF
ncbi:Uncharacterised protein [Helicobacter mustelae]|nr:Uncharacterised protein [Helicobacter mustelae]